MTAFRTTRRTTPDVGAPHSAPVGVAWTAAVLFCIIAAFHAAIALGLRGASTHKAARRAARSPRPGASWQSCLACCRS